MDIYEYLKKDHDKVLDLFEKFEVAKTPERKHSIFLKIAKELLVHAKSEDKSFYAILEKRGLEHDISDDAKKEHKEAEKLIHTCLKTKRLNEAWEAKVLKLRDAIKHHIHDEEGKMFRQAYDLIDDDESKVVRQKMHALKPKVPLPPELKVKKKSSKKVVKKKKVTTKKATKNIATRKKTAKKSKRSPKK